MRVKLTEKKIRSLAGTGTAYDILHDRTPSAGLRLSSLVRRDLKGLFPLGSQR